jgi:hypothetical protein
VLQIRDATPKTVTAPKTDAFTSRTQALKGTIPADIQFAYNVNGMKIGAVTFALRYGGNIISTSIFCSLGAGLI